MLFIRYNLGNPIKCHTRSKDLINIYNNDKNIEMFIQASIMPIKVLQGILFLGGGGHSLIKVRGSDTKVFT